MPVKKTVAAKKRVHFPSSSDDSYYDSKQTKITQESPKYSLYTESRVFATDLLRYPYSITFCNQSFNDENDFAILVNDISDRDEIYADFSSSCEAAPPITLDLLRRISLDMFPKQLTELGIAAKCLKDLKWHRASLCIDLPRDDFDNIDKLFDTFVESVKVEILFVDLESKQNVMIRDLVLLDQKFCSKMISILYQCNGVIGLKALSLEPELIKNVLLFGKTTHEANDDVEDRPRRWKKAFIKRGSLIQSDEIIDFAKGDYFSKR